MRGLKSKMVYYILLIRSFALGSVNTTNQIYVPTLAKTKSLYKVLLFAMKFVACPSILNEM